MSKLYDVILTAKEALDIYKEPDLSEFISLIDPILEALGKGNICGDNIEDIHIFSDSIDIVTSYVRRGYKNSESHVIPLNIINNENPIIAARENRLSKNSGRQRENYKLP